MWLASSILSVLADVWFVAYVIVYRQRLYAAPIWCVNSIANTLYQILWLLGTSWQLTDLLSNILRNGLRIALTLEAIWGAIVFINKPADKRRRLRWSLSVGLGLGVLSRWAGQSTMGRVRIGCLVALAAIILAMLLKEHLVEAVWRRHAAIVTVWMGSAAWASIMHSHRKDWMDGTALVVQALSMVYSSWVLTRKFGDFT